MKCDGQCDDLLSEGCKGKVRRVIVKSTATSPDPFTMQELYFNYCDTAINKDEQNGYRVEEVKSD